LSPDQTYILVNGVPKVSSPIAVDITSTAINLTYNLFPKVSHQMFITFKQNSGTNENSDSEPIFSGLNPTCSAAEGGGVNCSVQVKISDLANSAELQDALKANGTVPLIFTLKSGDASIGTVQTTAHQAPTIDTTKLQNAAAVLQDKNQMKQPGAQDKVQGLVTEALGYNSMASPATKQATNQDNIIKSVTALLQSNPSKDKSGTSSPMRQPQIAHTAFPHKIARRKRLAILSQILPRAFEPVG
jgi:hypothetical protein